MAAALFEMFIMKVENISLGHLSAEGKLRMHIQKGFQNIVGYLIAPIQILLLTEASQWGYSCLK